MPHGLDARSAMALGTAGAAAALAIERLQRNGQRPELGPIAVTGATGGVGSIAIDLLSGLGYEVVAFTGKSDAEGYLRALGAARVQLRQELTLGPRALESGVWGGAIDNVGGAMLSWLIRSTRERGNVASIGLAADAELHTSVMPFILRGVSLLGISVALPRAERAALWQRLATDLKPRHLDRIVTRTVGLEELPAAFDEVLAGRLLGRILVRIDDANRH
jgi:acrylyl-CoA reductase (NADPH)